MKIIVDIPDKVFENLLAGKVQYGGITARMIFNAVKSGTSLPKGYGRLIDADDLDITTIITDDYSGNEVLEVVLKEDIDNAPTIIEADKGGRE